MSIKNYQNFLVKKDLKDQCIKKNSEKKEKVRKKTMNVDIFSNQNLQQLTDCLFWIIQIKMIVKNGIKAKDII